MNMSKFIDFYSFILYFMMFTILLTLLSIPFHPIIMTILLIFYNSLIFINLSIWKMNYMYSILLFMIMISGLLIIFMYFSSLVSMEQNKMKITNSMIKMILYLLLILASLFYLSPTPIFFMNNYSLDFSTFLSYSQSMHTNILPIYKPPYTNLTILSIFYLLITLFIIVKICNSSQSKTMRKIK